MKRIVDVVNFNADASCLSSSSWLAMLQNGDGSLMVQWLRLYVKYGKKVTLGFPGSTVADIVIHNPEAINLINSHPDIFEIVLRPFAHDIALLRLGKGFAVNFESGCRVIMNEFCQVTPWFLPPEFMLTNEQLSYLKCQEVAGVFINPARFSLEIKKRIPTLPYQVKGLFDNECNCIPFHGELTNAYLHALQRYDAEQWNRIVVDALEGMLFSWRDGESPFFLPDGLAREACWLEQETEEVERSHLRDISHSFLPGELLDGSYYRSFPIHSFTAWMKEFRMLGFINRVADVERELERMTVDQRTLWLAVINSDIMSAVEKRSPMVVLTDYKGGTTLHEHVIRRSERGLEGEEFLVLLEEALVNGGIPDYVSESNNPHIVKLRGRMKYLRKVGISDSPKRIMDFH